MTTDAWTSFSKQSYITVTAHLIDNQVELQFFVLHTSEIKLRHRSENLLEHVKGVMNKFDLNHNVTVNYNGTNNDDILSVDEKDDDGVDFLKEVNYYDNEDQDIQASQDSSQESDVTQMSQSHHCDTSLQKFTNTLEINHINATFVIFIQYNKTHMREKTYQCHHCNKSLQNFTKSLQTHWR